jgi:hypothetical protein
MKKRQWTLPEPQDIADFCRDQRISRGATRMWLGIRERVSESGRLYCSAQWLDATLGFSLARAPAARRFMSWS